METATLEDKIQVHRVQNSRLNKVDFDNLVFGQTFSDHMFVADFQDGEWQDIRIQPFKEFSISPSMSALHYGQAIFEGMKAYRNAVDPEEVLLFRPDQNAARFNKSAARMCMPTIPEELFVEALKQLLAVDKGWVPSNESHSLYIRPFMFASDISVGLRPSTNYCFAIFTCPVGGYYANPVRIKVEENFVRATEGGVGFAKNAGNYAAAMLPTRLANEEGFDQLLWTDAKTHEYVEEAGSMNIIFQIGDTLVTAPPSDSILHGITRRSVKAIAEHWGIKFEERPIKVAELVEAFEKGQINDAFGAGTAATIAPIASITFRGTEYTVPQKEDSFSKKAFKFLGDLQRGKEEDIFNWTVPVR